MTAPSTPSIGDLLRHWRAHRGVSQLELSSRTGVSTRHLSFVENAHSRPSRELVLRLAEALDVPRDARDAILVAAGHAPEPHDEPPGAAGRASLDALLDVHLPHPALVLDAHWDLVRANAVVHRVLDPLPAHLREPRCNLVRATLHPEGLAPAVENLAEVAAHLLGRVDRQIERTADPALGALRREVERYVPRDVAARAAAAPDVPIPFHLRTPEGVVRLTSTTGVIGLPGDVLAGLALEVFSPADEAAARWLADTAR